MTKAERRTQLKKQFAKSEWFRLRYRRLVASGMPPAAAHEQAHKDLSAQCVTDNRVLVIVR